MLKNLLGLHWYICSCANHPVSNCRECNVLSQFKMVLMWNHLFWCVRSKRGKNKIFKNLGNDRRDVNAHVCYSIDVFTFSDAQRIQEKDTSKISFFLIEGQGQEYCFYSGMWYLQKYALLILTLWYLYSTLEPNAHNTMHISLLYNLTSYP